MPDRLRRSTNRRRVSLAHLPGLNTSLLRHKDRTKVISLRGIKRIVLLNGKMNDYVIIEYDAPPRLRKTGLLAKGDVVLTLRYLSNVAAARPIQRQMRQRILNAARAA